MSDNKISIIPQIVDFSNRHDKAKEILDWLVKRDIVKKEKTDCILSSGLGYAISNGAKLIVEEPSELPYDLITNGLEIVTEHTVFDSGKFMDEDYEDDEDIELPESNLGFIFWNWPEFKEDFINEFKIKLNCVIEILVGGI